MDPDPPPAPRPPPEQKRSRMPPPFAPSWEQMSSLLTTQNLKYTYVVILVFTLVISIITIVGYTREERVVKFPGVKLATLWVSIMQLINTLLGIAVLTGRKGYNTPIMIGVWFGSSFMFSAFCLVLGEPVVRWRGGGEVAARWRGGEVAGWRSGEVVGWRGGEVARWWRIARPTHYFSLHALPPHSLGVLFISMVTYFKELWAYG